MAAQARFAEPPQRWLSRIRHDRGVDARYQSQHVGRSLLLDAMTRVLAAGELIGIRARLVHAIEEQARDRYARFGFERSPTHPLHQLLLIKDLRASIEQGPGP